MEKCNCFFAKGTKSIDTPKITKSNIDPKKMYELLLMEYTHKFLTNLKDQYESTYMQKRQYEKTLTPHTGEHKSTIQQMVHIMGNLSIIADEIKLLQENSDTILTCVKNILI